ncbi:MAG: polysaccharide pyruvyl transferase family protein [Verrucomicrobia bacterium]|nr:polysaccharide pyruvyl transferase family protein [Verrucomicrobiota bacterium]NBU09217.1 polysaccharide pyruvyl transferase family protein [Pseudomonadota bacterium]NDA67934.1 polysaccharide pyruvyl transferase family protein [Verrucomicrobiota bacterium]NDB74628.1 polysaccharide pyruvyl transferase family protein [Verrucomicrobiota bacterium]NDD37763.1 polysaccharide pyruvyl transferase family protein [Verrucomicrobiota bacterium]
MIASRRHFLATALTTALAASVRAADKRPPRLLLRSSWQTVNIGDIAHTPGVLALIERHLPGVEVRLWPSKVDNGVEEMLLARFPKLRLVKGPEALKAAFAECDFLLHGSGPSLVAQNDVARWAKETGKPYGVYGITLSLQGSTATSPASDKSVAATVAVLSGAKFAYFRDSVSLALAQQRGCTCPLMEFGPDGAFATDLRDDAKATAFLKANGLEEGNFLCCIPRLRFTPYWTIHKERAMDPVKHARNEALKEQDHAPHRQAIIEVLRQTKLKVLICPEDQTQMAVGKELLYDPLPADVKPRAVWRPDYWLTGEAISVYTCSAGLFGNEMHSPIMCIGNGIPAIVCRWAEQTSKGIMWRDIGLGDWLFDFDKEEERAKLVPAVLAMAKDPAAAKAKAAKAREFVMSKFAASMGVVKQHLPS